MPNSEPISSTPPSRSWISAAWMMALHQQALGVDQDVTLLALDLLAGIKARRVDRAPPFSALLTLWLSMIAAVGLASRPASRGTSREARDGCGRASGPRPGVADSRSPCSAVAGPSAAPPTGSRWRRCTSPRSPPPAHRPSACCRRASPAGSRGDDRPFFVGQVARIAQLAAVISSAVLRTLPDPSPTRGTEGKAVCWTGFRTKRDRGHSSYPRPPMDRTASRPSCTRVRSPRAASPSRRPSAVGPRFRPPIRGGGQERCRGRYDAYALRTGLWGVRNRLRPASRASLGLAVNAC